MEGAESKRVQGDQVEQRSLTSTFLNAVDQGAGWTVGAALVVKGSQTIGRGVDKIKQKDKD